MARSLRLVLLVLAAVVVAQLLVQRGERAPAGELHPPLVLDDLQGNSVDLARLRGKVVLVNFWATWCGPCRAELPELARFWSEHRGRCFELLGVAEESAMQDVLRVAPGIPYPVLVDQRAELVGPWRVPGYPRSVVVDAEGRIRQVFQGAVTAAELERAVAPLLPATCPAS